MLRAKLIEKSKKQSKVLVDNFSEQLDHDYLIDRFSKAHNVYINGIEVGDKIDSRVDRLCTNKKELELSDYEYILKKLLKYRGEKNLETVLFFSGNKDEKTKVDRFVFRLGIRYYSVFCVKTDEITFKVTEVTE